MDILTKGTVHLIRRDICMKCDQLNHTIKVCKACGCWIPAKVHAAFTDCPLSKWPKIEDGEK